MSIDKKYSLYVFDLDGTIADTKDDIVKALKEVIASAGFKVPEEKDIVAAVGRGIYKTIQTLTGFEDKQLEPYANAFLKKYDEICCDNVKLYEGARQLLFRLKKEGAVLALVTMKSKEPTLKILASQGIDVFDEVVAFEDTNRRKPDPDSLLKMLQKYDIPPDMALMVGDSITDVLYAKAAGADVCILEHGYGKVDDIISSSPNYLIKSFLDF